MTSEAAAIPAPTLEDAALQLGLARLEIAALRRALERERDQHHAVAGRRRAGAFVRIQRGTLALLCDEVEAGLCDGCDVDADILAMVHGALAEARALLNGEGVPLLDAGELAAVGIPEATTVQCTACWQRSREGCAECAEVQRKVAAAERAGQAVEAKLDGEMP